MTFSFKSRVFANVVSAYVYIVRMHAGSFIQTSHENKATDYCSYFKVIYTDCLLVGEQKF